MVNGGQTTDTSYPANTATWAENDTDRYIRLETDGTISGEDAGNLAKVYALQNDEWVRYDWDVYEAETIRSESLPFATEKFKVVFTNGLEWLISLQPVEQGIASMDFELPALSSSLDGKTITMQRELSDAEMQHHLVATAEKDSEVLQLFVQEDNFLTDGDQNFAELSINDNVITLVTSIFTVVEIQEFIWS